MSVIVSIIIISSVLISDRNSGWQRANSPTSVFPRQNAPVLGTEFPPDLPQSLPPDLSYEVDNSGNWKYAILQCESKRNEEVHIRIITVNDFSAAEGILSRLSDGASFAKLATQESNHPSKSDGGDLGTFKMLDLNEHFRAALIGIAEGEHTGIIELGNN